MTDNTQPLSFETVLSAEYTALRPGADFNTADREELFRRAVHQYKPFTALCISGGGIRSATFALGAIQGMAEHGILEGFDYMSTVSGGGYIGGWLTAWIKRAKGLANVVPGLLRNAREAGEGLADPIQHLREYNNYLTPKIGAFSGDTWTLAATIIRNVFLNWLVLIPLFLCALMVPRIALSSFYYAQLTLENSGSADAVKFSIAVAYVLPLLAVALFASSMFSTLRYLPGVGKYDHTSADFTRYVLIPLVLAAVAFCAYDCLHFLDADQAPGLVTLILCMLATCAAAWLIYLASCGKGLAERWRLLSGPLSVAIALLGIGTGIAAWMVSYFLATATWTAYVTFAPPLMLLSFSVSGAVFIGLSSGALEDDDREWLSRAAAKLLLFCFVWISACALVLIAPSWAFHWNVWGKSLLGGLGAAAAGASSLAGFRGAKTGPGQSASRPKTSFTGLVLKIAPVLFLVLLTVGLAMATNLLVVQLSASFHPGVSSASWYQHELLVTHTRLPEAALLALGFFLLSWVMARYININVFSLEGMYRNRLIRAYLGASNPKRAANKFTGFSASDNFKMHEIDPTLRPFHVLNLTLNLVSGDRLAWQQRKAESFTVTPLHSGSSMQQGYRDSAGYGGKDGISLGTAVTISGAAASPNMGYHSSPLVGLIMTLFNVRLGAWMGNPAKEGRATWKEAGPRSAIGALVKEALGLTSNKSDYVYLSDGGHFENLGIYEMVLRRCRTIVVLDSGCDETFSYEDLGNALRKIRIDLKIPINFGETGKMPSSKPKKRCFTATIQYSALDPTLQDGELLYIKPMILGNEPPDVASYHSSHLSFPHQSTADQWFDESQTESYRMLGLHTVDDIFAGWKRGSLAELRRYVDCAGHPEARDLQAAQKELAAAKSA
jgi:hypothetical protein